MGGDVQSRYVADADGAPPENGVRGILTITADKGLAGAYNLNVIRAAQALCEKDPGAKLFVVGAYGRRWFAQHGAPLDKGFVFPAQPPTMERAREMADYLLDRYDKGELNELTIVYTDMKNSLFLTQRTERLLPLGALADGADAARDPTRYEYIPSAEAVLAGMIRSYAAGYLYAALLDSYCSEQNARVGAMDAANRNARELLDGLSLQLNRRRQAAITREITEVSAGARAQKNKKR